MSHPIAPTSLLHSSLESPPSNPPPSLPPPFFEKTLSFLPTKMAPAVAAVNRKWRINTLTIMHTKIEKVRETLPVLITHLQENYPLQTSALTALLTEADTTDDFSFLQAASVLVKIKKAIFDSLQAMTPPHFQILKASVESDALLELMLEASLHTWLHEAPADEAEAREIAKNRILTCFREKTPSLTLSRLQLSSLPSGLVFLTHVQELSLSYNKLTALPLECTQLRLLTKLDISYNQLADFPMHICTLNNLSQLSLESNKLHILPPDIRHLTNLRYLLLHRNKFVVLPPEIYELSASIQVGSPSLMGFWDELKDRVAELKRAGHSTPNILW